MINKKKKKVSHIGLTVANLHKKYIPIMVASSNPRRRTFCNLYTTISVIEKIHYKNVVPPISTRKEFKVIGIMSPHIYKKCTLLG